MNISIKFTSKCGGCGVALDCENLNVLNSLEAAKDYLNGFTEGEYDFCEDCETERGIVLNGGLKEESCGCVYNWNDHFTETSCNNHSQEQREFMMAL